MFLPSLCPVSLLCCHILSSLSIPSSAFKMQHCLNTLITALWAEQFRQRRRRNRSQAQGTGEQAAQKTREVSRENDYAEDNGQKKQGEAERWYSMKDEERGKTIWPRERSRLVEARNKGKERNTNAGAQGRYAVVRERVERVRITG